MRGFSVILISVLLVAFCIENALASGPKEIIEATPNEFPWIIRVTDSDANDGNPTSCVGAILNENWVITDYNCGRDLASLLTVYAGDHDVLVEEPTQQVRGVVRIVRTPGWPRGGEFELQVYGQIALLELNEPLELNEFVQPIKFITSGQPFTRQNVTKVLWVSMAGPNPSSKLIKNTDDSLASDGTCLDYYNAVEFPFTMNFDARTLICSGLFDFSSHCQNVRGEALVCDVEEGPVLCGIGHSYSYHCTRQMRQLPSTLMSTFSEIGSFWSWISARTTIQPENNATWVDQDTGCGGILSGSTGSLTYKPDGSVSPNERCTWTIRAEDFSMIRIQLTQYNLKVEDLLVVSDFNGEEPGDFGTADLNSIGTDYTVRGPVVFITFASGSNNPGGGFSLEFFGSGYPEALGYNSIDAHFNASGTYHYPVGIDFYPNWGSASFVINPESTQDVTLTFTELAVSGLRDFVYIYEWKDGRFDFVEKIWEDMNVPRSYSTSEGVFVILFLSDDSVSGRGFTIGF